MQIPDCVTEAFDGLGMTMGHITTNSYLHVLVLGVRLISFFDSKGSAESQCLPYMMHGGLSGSTNSDYMKRNGVAQDNGDWFGRVTVGTDSIAAPAHAKGFKKGPVLA